MRTAGARVRPIDLPAIVEDHSRATAAAQRDWQYEARKDYSFQLHLPHFPVTRPCLCRACFCQMDSASKLFLPDTQL